jgi:hypothetical protein
VTRHRSRAGVRLDHARLVSRKKPTRCCVLRNQLFNAHQGWERVTWVVVKCDVHGIDVRVRSERTAGTRPASGGWSHMGQTGPSTAT